MSLEKFAEISHEILQERVRQEQMWGEQNWRPSQWLAILGEEYGEVCRAVCDIELVRPEERTLEAWQNYRDELVQVAAVAIQMIEANDRARESGIDGLSSPSV
jgi:NTP pyrophosphatase (non-canonical NTP hydrolase)